MFQKKKRQAVVLLSTQYHDATIHEYEDKKLEIILHYNETKGGVDLGDMISEYSCVRITIRWPLRLFMEIIDIASLNTYILWKENNLDWHKNNLRMRKCFLDELMLMLAKPHFEERAQMPVASRITLVVLLKQWVYQ
ncbi:hypothetical protein PR048_002910 [Dryococelus australis]|uniref:PiggyBac transposable element-derived protein domain-containing protein n=1 Tax=Dryococelus australis TaxID=614101 RepID=A0ABQ9IMK6_9NEOP|nr:hypothetical protein PR048_002910 [Dryococelus australis]